MRPVWPILVALLVAGCVTSAPEVDPDANTTAPTTPTVDDAAPEGQDAGPLGPRGELSIEHFLLLPDRSLGQRAADAPPLEATKVPEIIPPHAFYQAFAQGITLTPWSTAPFDVPFEMTQEADVLLRFVVDRPAVSLNPSAAGFPGVGAWLGTPDRMAFFALATDAPDTLEAGKEYVVHLKATPPQGGFFVRAGESLALYTFLAYQTPDRSPASYVVGGDDPAGFALRHHHFNVTAPRETLILDETGELASNPSISAAAHPEPVLLTLTVPPDAVYIEVKATGASKAADRVDLDADVRTKGGEVIGEGSGPTATETIVLGPGNLQAYGRDLAIQVRCACASGAVYSVQVTAFSG